LENYIRKLHSVCGNAVTEGRYIVFGIGSTQLLNAAVYALSSENSSSPSNVLASIPFYPLTGHAGTRFGWAIIKDKDIYDKVLNYISVADLGISKDTQLRVLKLIKVAVEGDGMPLFEFSYNKMKDRWDRLTSVFSKSTKFSIQQRHPLYCNFFNETRLPSPAYAWVKCEREEDHDCSAVLKAGKIIGRNGSLFSADDRYTRRSLIKSQDDFELLLKRLTELI
ncbi:hypothetical protein R6Q59_033276, partial [Mikania micrantha]